MSNYSGSVPDTAGRRLDWMASMACRNVAPSTFFDPGREHEARLICVVRCPVRRQCLANVQRMEAGKRRDAREGVVAGLLHNERWRLDTKVVRAKCDTPALVFDGEPPACGTYEAMLRHLSRGELVDPECWSAEVRRERLNRIHNETLRADRAEAS
ncbi:WhiB family transcriptional regulator [Streptomyces chartreusis]|uniref:WhiB family transcriptional regulator n=1 Tax=Streptomyces chartreusis TaxID=1969 RepID=UPI00380751AA